ncbi:hypothetical protein DN508_35800, partial [Burkholderia multivorans]
MRRWRSPASSSSATASACAGSRASPRSDVREPTHPHESNNEGTPENEQLLQHERDQPGRGERWTREPSWRGRRCHDQLAGPGR